MIKRGIAAAACIPLNPLTSSFKDPITEAMIKNTG
jgi:hypothetical protein